MHLPKPNNVTCFYSGNVDRVKYTKTGDVMRDHCEEQFHMEADIRGYIEHNLKQSFKFVKCFTQLSNSLAHITP